MTITAGELPALTRHDELMAYSDPDAPRIVKRTTIRMPYLTGDHIESARSMPLAALLVEPGSRIALRRAAEQMAQQFRRETRYDFVPYAAQDPGGQLVVLLPSRRFLVGQGKLIAGVVGIDPEVRYLDEPEPRPCATWVYVHPYERGSGLISDVWLHLVQRWPSLTLPGPFTPAGLALLRSLIAKGHHPSHIGTVPAERAQ
jgi:hypothetical protein